MFLEIIYFLGIVALGAAFCWLGLLTFCSWRYQPKVNREAAPLRLGVIIPAHNEEASIGETIRNIYDADYPEEQLVVIVIADNCLDNTAEQAEAAGAEPVVRENLEQRGKGYALDWFLANCKHLYRDLDALCFVDADAIVDRHMFTEISHSLNHPEVQIVQGFNGVANPYDNWRTALNSAAFNVFNQVRMAGNNYLFDTSMLKGLGMAFETEILKELGWPAHSEVEDAEFTILLLEEGHHVHYNPAAVITSEMAQTRRQADSQRLRWEGGRFALARAMVPVLIKKCLQGRIKFLHILMDFIVPPLSLLVALLAVWTIFGVSNTPAAWPVIILFWLITFAYVASGQLQRHAEPRLWLYLLAAPIFILWKIMIYLKIVLTRRSRGWKRTLRKSEISK